MTLVDKSMYFRFKKILSVHWSFLVLLILLSGYYFWGISSVPFHPDESTYINMSRDFETLFSDPFSMAWYPDTPRTSEVRYRLIDAPVTRYLIGLGQMLGDQPIDRIDWNWSKSWDENDNAGALPNLETLSTARLSITLLFPVALVFMYLIGLKLGGRRMGFLAGALLGFNSLSLLHARRAMAEGAILFGVVFFLWSLAYAKRFPWLTGLALAIAVNAKYSTIVLFPIGLIAILNIRRAGPISKARLISNFLKFMVTFGVFFLALNPFLWRYPFQAAIESWNVRKDLTERQVDDVRHLAPKKVLDTVGERVLSLTANLFLAPPSFAEIGNYLDETADDVAIYLAIPGHNLGRNFIGGGIYLTITLMGVVLIILRMSQKNLGDGQFFGLILAAAIFQMTGLLLAVPLPWQRYSVALLPYVCIISAYGLTPLLQRK